MTSASDSTRLSSYAAISGQRSAANTSQLPSRSISPFGIEIAIDLREPLSRVRQDAFRDLFYDNEVVVFRNQDLSMMRQLEVMELFGPVLKSSEGKTYLSPDDGVLGVQSLGFHSDWYFVEFPMQVLSLHAKEIDGASWTSFASMTRAWRRMPEALRHKVTGRKFINVDYDRLPGVPYEVPQGAWSYAYDIPLLHRVTGRPYAYAIENYTARIEGFEPEESAATLAELASYLKAPDNVYKHIWHDGDLVIWDNQAIQHARPDLNGVKKRRLQRVAIGEKTMEEQAPGFGGIAYVNKT